MPFALHYFLHLGFPLIIALVFFRSSWRLAYGILLATMLVDIDHVFATPIYQADRCSIGFHTLHTGLRWWFMLACCLVVHPFG